MIDIYWLEQTEDEVAGNDAWLSADEVVRLSGMKFARRRADWRLGRWTAKHALTRFWGLAADAEMLARIEVRPGPGGAPEAWLDSQRAPAIISITHRGGRAMCAVTGSGAELGCDLEVIEPRSDPFLSDYFTAAEQVQLKTVSGADRMRVAALLWSAKESALKAMRVGLRLDTRSVSVEIENAKDGLWNPFTVRTGTGRIFEGWWQQSAMWMRTVAACPAPVLPIALNAATHYVKRRNFASGL